MEFNVENYLSNLSYINKDFPSLWNEILETIPKLTNKWLPSQANGSDPLIVLLKELAIIADKLNYNIDKNILELFPATLTQLRSAYNVYESLGYTPDWYVSATTGITITYTGMVNGERLDSSITNPETITIPKWTQVSDEDGEIIYTIMEGIPNITPGIPEKFSVLAMQGTLNDFEINGSTQITINNLDSQNRIYFNENNIAQNGIIISNFSDFSDYNYAQMAGTTLNEEDTYEYYNKWRRVTNLNQYLAGNRIYKLGIDSVTNNVYIQFPDDIGNLIGDGLYIKYILSDGEEGNVGKNDLTQIINEVGFTNENSTDEITLLPSDFVVTNRKSSQNGVNPLDIDEMRREFNRTIGVFETLVTLRDYENYIYEYEDNNGDHLVSNIRVSDRYNDLTSSLTYKTMGTDGAFSDVLEVLQVNGVDKMTAYDIKFYPLKPVNPIETKNDLDTTFETLENINEISETIDDVKCISHDFARNIVESGDTVEYQGIDIGSPILIPYDLNGQIYLQTAVSEEEALEISSKIQLQLLKTLNSRELEWGTPIDYGNVVDTIKNTDNRVQYVALDAITYKAPETLPENEINVSSEETFDVIKRNILIGNQSWTEYSDFLYNYNEGNPDIKGPGVSVSGVGEIESVSNIGTYINITGNSANAYIVNTNETFTVLIPQYNTIATYGNYLYYVARGTSNIIPAGTPYELKDNQFIYVFETRDAAESFLNGYNTDLASYILSPGTIIQSSVNIEIEASPREYENMGSSVTIDILERASGILRTSDNIASNQNNSAGLLIATNSIGLRNALINGTKYTLLSDEYLFYTDDLGIELGIISEGTTIYSNKTITFGETALLSTENVEDVLNGSTLNNFNIWLRINDNSTAINYELNELYTFGSNYIIRFMHRTANNDTPEYLSINNLQSAVNSFLSLDNIDLIKYAQLDENGNIPDENTENWSELPRSLGDDKYQILIRMSLVTGYGIPQEISFKNSISSTSPNIITPTTSQQVNINFNIVENDTPYFMNIGSNNAIQTTKLLSYQGGSQLNLVGNEQNVSFYSYTSNNLTPSYGDDGFINILSMNIPEGEENIILNVPGLNNTVAIIPYVSLNYQGVVNYLIAKTQVSSIIISKLENNVVAGSISLNSSSSISNISKIGRPYIVNIGANYYIGNNNYTSVLSIIPEDSNASILTNNSLYKVGYSPIYQPTEENLIADPTLPSSYFLDQHPYNRYVLPKLDNINITISPLSITR